MSPPREGEGLLPTSTNMSATLFLSPGSSDLLFSACKESEEEKEKPLKPTRRIEANIEAREFISELEPCRSFKESDFFKG